MKKKYSIEDCLLPSFEERVEFFLGEFNAYWPSVRAGEIVRNLSEFCKKVCSLESSSGFSIHKTELLRFRTSPHHLSPFFVGYATIVLFPLENTSTFVEESGVADE